MAIIYVIDDDEQLLQMVGLILERGGHTPELFSTPARALERIKSRRPHLVILDVMMPRISGHDVIRIIRSDRKTAELPILILTARSQPIDRETALNSGANEFLSKPLVPDELLATVNQLLDNSIRAAPRQKRRGAFVISMAGLRGGTGRTTLSVNLAAAILRASRRNVCIWDLSASGGQVVLHFRLQPQTHWSDLLEQHRVPDASVLPDFLLQHQSGIHLLAAPALPQAPETPSAMQARTTLEALRHAFDFVIIDCPPVMSPAVVAVLSQSDMILDVITPDLITIQQAKQTGRSLAMAGISLPQKAYVLNHVAPGGLDFDIVERGLGAKLAFRIGFDQNQARAVAQGTPLCLKDFQGPISSVVLPLGQRIWDRVSQAQQTPSPSATVA